MFQHGKQKSEKRELTKEEQEKIDISLKKIKDINADILKKRRNPNLQERYNRKNLEYLLKASVMMTDSTTIWNYRKEIITDIKAKESESEFYDFLVKEIKDISGIMLQNPKSYVLWHHRYHN